MISVPKVAPYAAPTVRTNLIPWRIVVKSKRVHGGKVVRETLWERRVALRTREMREVLGVDNDWVKRI